MKHLFVDFCLGDDDDDHSSYINLFVVDKDNIVNNVDLINQVIYQPVSLLPIQLVDDDDQTSQPSV